MKQTADLMKKTPDDLRKELDRIQIELMRMRVQIATGGAGKETGKVRQLRRAVARIETLLRSTKEVRVSR